MIKTRLLCFFFSSFTLSISFNINNVFEKKKKTMCNSWNVHTIKRFWPIRRNCSRLFRRFFFFPFELLAAPMIDDNYYQCFLMFFSLFIFCMNSINRKIVNYNQVWMRFGLLMIESIRVDDCVFVVRCKCFDFIYYDLIWMLSGYYSFSSVFFVFFVARTN